MLSGEVSKDACILSSSVFCIEQSDYGLFNSDGVLTFSTGAFAPGVTVDKALYKMWAIDGGLKYSGFALNGQYYMLIP